MNRTRRDRDADGRARSARPRDGLGRPLPYGAPGVERQPEGVERAPEETLREAQRLLDAGLPFHAHEVFEDAWKSCGEESERELWRGLAQLAVGLTHAARGNTAGGARLLRRGADRIGAGRGHVDGVGVGGIGADRVGADGIGADGIGAGRGHADAEPYGIDVGGLVAWARELAGRVEEHGAVDPVAEAPRLGPDVGTGPDR